MFYGYSARVPDDMVEGCSVLLVPKTDYIQILRRDVEKTMNDTVQQPPLQLVRLRP